MTAPQSKPPPDTRCVCCKQPATRYCDGWDNIADLITRRTGGYAKGDCGEPLCDECEHLPYTNRHIPITR